MNTRLFVVTLAGLSMLGALSIDAYLPALPSIATHFGVTLTAAQQSLTIYLFAFATMTLFYGTLSDSFGRRPVILVALILYLASSIGAGCSPTLGWLLFFRLLQGLSAGAGGVVGRAIIGDLFSGPEAERIMSYVSMVFGIAPALAPILGGWLLAVTGWRSIFLFIALFCLILWIVCWRTLPESLPVSKRHAFHFKLILSHYWSVASHASFMFQALGTAMAFAGIMIYVGSAPVFVFNILHLKETDFGWLFIPLVGGLTLGSMMAGKMSHSFPSATTIRIGFIVMALSSLSNALYCWFFTVQLWVVLPIGLYSFGAALVSPTMTVQTLSLFPHVRGLASSLQTFFFMIIFAVGSGFICPLLFGSAFKLACGTAVGTFLSITFWFIGRYLSEHEPPIDEPELKGADDAPGDCPPSAL